MFESSGWSLVTILGPVVLAVVIIYALVRRRRLTTREKVEQHHAVEELYHDTPGDRVADADRDEPRK